MFCILILTFWDDNGLYSSLFYMLNRDIWFRIKHLNN